ncbi:MAG: CesT family type III secretion system chaperone [Puniceicoccales bacterium]|jgi:hypothetical protein|nr:CesT family type III secretion system chaperone [Puniceicoccales bacterium]
MEYVEAMEIVSELFKISQWAENEYGERHAVLDGDIEIRVFQESHDKMIIQGMFGEPIVNASAANSSELKLKYLLQANFIRLIHYDDVLSIDKKTERLATTRRISLANASLESIMDTIESFVQNVDFWDVAQRRKQSFASASPLLSLFKRR